MISPINISDFTYDLPQERIAKYPLEKRDSSKLLVYKDGIISQDIFRNIKGYIPKDSPLVLNNTKVIRARLFFIKPTGAHIEILCLEPHNPASYEEAFSVKKTSSWKCVIGGAKKFNGPIYLKWDDNTLMAEREDTNIVRFTWNTEDSFGELLEKLGRTPIPPYLKRDSEEIDQERYQTTYAIHDGSVAAPTAGLHFTDDIIKSFNKVYPVTLHVGAGTFLPVKESDATKHQMHKEFIEVKTSDLKNIAEAQGNITAVGTTSLRTLESLAILGQRVILSGDANPDKTIGQYEGYDFSSKGDELINLYNWAKENKLERILSSTQIMITPSYKLRTISGIITNFHQPQSTLLLLIGAIVGEKWREIYKYALENDFRFLSYGDSSYLQLKR